MDADGYARAWRLWCGLEAVDRSAMLVEGDEERLLAAAVRLPLGEEGLLLVGEGDRGSEAMGTALPVL